MSEELQSDGDDQLGSVRGLTVDQIPVLAGAQATGRSWSVDRPLPDAFGYQRASVVIGLLEGERWDEDDDNIVLTRTPSAGSAPVNPPEHVILRSADEDIAPPADRIPLPQRRSRRERSTDLPAPVPRSRDEVTSQTDSSSWEGLDVRPKKANVLKRKTAETAPSADRSTSQTAAESPAAKPEGGRDKEPANKPEKLDSKPEFGLGNRPEADPEAQRSEVTPPAVRPSEPARREVDVPTPTMPSAPAHASPTNDAAAVAESRSAPVSTTPAATPPAPPVPAPSGPSDASEHRPAPTPATQASVPPPAKAVPPPPGAAPSASRAETLDPTRQPEPPKPTPAPTPTPAPAPPTASTAAPTFTPTAAPTPAPAVPPPPSAKPASPPPPMAVIPPPPSAPSGPRPPHAATQPRSTTVPPPPPTKPVPAPPTSTAVPPPPPPPAVPSHKVASPPAVASHKVAPPPPPPPPSDYVGLDRGRFEATTVVAGEPDPTEAPSELTPSSDGTPASGFRSSVQLPDRETPAVLSATVAASADAARRQAAAIAEAARAALAQQDSTAIRELPRPTRSRRAKGGSRRRLWIALGLAALLAAGAIFLATRGDENAAPPIELSVDSTPVSLPSQTNATAPTPPPERYAVFAGGELILRGRVATEARADQLRKAFAGVVGDAAVTVEYTVDATAGEQSSERIIAVEQGVFVRNTAIHDKEFARVVDLVVRLTDLDPGVRVSIDVYTDASANDDGSEEINTTVSRAQANEVAEKALENGADPTRITFAGHGSSNPIAPNDTDENRRRNRRIEITVTGLPNA